MCVNALSCVAAPSRGFLQEFAFISSPGHVFLDVDNTTGDWVPQSDSQIRVSIPKAELNATANMLGYKGMLRPDLAAYVNAGISTASSEKWNFKVGAAYAWALRGLFFNVNPELVRDNGALSLQSNGAAFMRLRVPTWMGKVHLAGEINLSEKNSSLMALAGGVRWQYQRYLTLDLMILGSGGKMKTGVIRTPAALRLNLSI